MDLIFVQPVDVRIANRENDEQLKLLFFWTARFHSSIRNSGRFPLMFEWE